MSTNYYACDLSGNRLHVGKSSAGWAFALRVYPFEGINSLQDWKQRFEATGCVIKDEYERVVTPDQMMKIITDRSWGDEGPAQLRRVRVDGKHCIGHGGTWDVIAGEFC